jgi:hypothetical protein
MVAALLAVACSDRLTTSRAATILRHSKAFLSGPPESQPVFDGVTSLLSGTPEHQESDSYLVSFKYHWPPNPQGAAEGRASLTLTASVVLRRVANGWAVDDQLSRDLVPSWPQLPRSQSLFPPPVGSRSPAPP